MAEEKMDIDVVEPSSQYISASKHTLLHTEDSLPKAKRAKLSLPPDQLTTVYNELEKTSYKKMWSNVFERGDGSQMEDLMSSVLVVITRLLSRTDLKAIVLPELDDDEAAGVLADFTADEINQFKDGLRKGVVDKNWSDLVAHRTF
jgi:Mg/Co/Ni transporter MgtE